MMYTQKYATYMLVLSVALSVLFIGSVAFAQQGGGGSGGGSSNSSSAQQDRDRTQDPAAATDDLPAQDRAQDQDKLMDGTGENCDGTGDCDGTPDQDRLKLMDGSGDNCIGDGDCDGTPDQDRDRLMDGTGDNCVGDGECDGVPDQLRDRVHADTATSLRDYIQEQTQLRLQQTPAADQAGAGVMNRTHTEAQLATEAFEMAEPLLGQHGPRMSEVAREVNQAMDGLATREAALQDRSRLQLFLFGSDDEVVSEMQQAMQENQTRMQEMQQLLDDCGDCDEGATQVLVTQLQNMQREQDRLQQVTDDAASRQGLFGFLFGWLR